MLHQMMRKKTWPIQQQAEPASNTTRMVGSNFLKPTILPKSKIRRSDSIDDNCMCWTPGAYNEANYI